MHAEVGKLVVRAHQDWLVDCLDRVAVPGHTLWTVQSPSDHLRPKWYGHTRHEASAANADLHTIEHDVEYRSPVVAVGAHVEIHNILVFCLHGVRCLIGRLTCADSRCQQYGKTQD